LASAIPDWMSQPIPVTAEKIDRSVNRLMGLPEVDEWEQQRQESVRKFDEAFPVMGGAMQGAHDFAQGLLTPANILLMLTAPQSKLLSAYFAAHAPQRTLLSFLWKDRSTMSKKKHRAHPAPVPIQQRIWAHTLPKSHKSQTSSRKALDG
jgi:hypothetical protein